MAAGRFARIATSSVGAAAQALPYAAGAPGSAGAGVVVVQTAWACAGLLKAAGAFGTAAWGSSAKRSTWWAPNDQSGHSEVRAARDCAWRVAGDRCYSGADARAAAPSRKRGTAGPWLSPCPRRRGAARAAAHPRPDATRPASRPSLPGCGHGRGNVAESLRGC